MIVVQMANDDILDSIGGDAEREQSVSHRLDRFTLTLSPYGFIEAGVDNDRSGRPDDGPTK